MSSTNTPVGQFTRYHYVLMILSIFFTIFCCFCCQLLKRVKGEEESQRRDINLGEVFCQQDQERLQILRRQNCPEQEEEERTQVKDEQGANVLLADVSKHPSIPLSSDVSKHPNISLSSDVSNIQASLYLLVEIISFASLSFAFLQQME